MEACGFARAGVPGEYSPGVVFATVTSDVSATGVFSNLLTVPITVETPGEVVTCVFSATAMYPLGAGGGTFQLSVDGVAVAQTNASGPSAGSRQGYYITRALADLAVGPHNITIEWKLSGLQILNVTNPFGDHATLICYRSRLMSDREIDGFVQRGWQTIYSLGAIGTALTTTKTSTSATITDPLISNFQCQTRYAQSALLIRFSVSGDQPDAGTERDARFQLYVDGVPRFGVGDSSGVSGFANVCFNAALIAVVPVQAGIHNIDVYWSGSSTGSGLRIDPATGYSHCSLVVEEVFCEDVNTLSDMEGFVTAQFASRNLPRVAFQALRTDVAGIGLGFEFTLLDRLFYVVGETSALQIEATASLKSIFGSSLNYRIYVDDVLKRGSQQEANNGTLSSQGVSIVVPVAMGNHRVQIRVQQEFLQSFECGSHPEYSHANALIREIPA